MSAINYDKHIWEGWKVIDFINELKPQLDMIIYSNIAALHNIVYPNKSIPLIVDELGWSDKAIAFKCRSEIINLNGVCANKIPHITAYTINDGKPVDSNYITNWIPIIPMTVFARLYFVI